MRLLLNPDRRNRAVRSRSRQAGFSMLEILVVIGIIGILVGYGAVNYVSQLSQSRVDAGLLSGLQDASSKSLSGQFEEPIQIWIEAKNCEEYPFDSQAYCLPGGSNIANAYPLTDPETFPDGIMIADVDGNVPGMGKPQIFYVEFNARGSIEKVYFDGEESKTNYNEIQPLIHIARIGEVFTIGTDHGDYSRIMGKLGSNKLKWADPITDESKERYKVQTIEIVRLTGKTRTYDYAILNPWPIDEFIK